MGSEDGNADEKPVHEEKVVGFYLDRTEVTVSAFGKCVEAGKCKAETTATGYATEADNKKWSPLCNWGKADRDQHPMNCVDFAQAKAYCRWADKRLPTEAEWEYAARGKDGRKYPWGNSAPGPELLNACGSECVAMFKAKFNVTLKTMYEGDDHWPDTAPVGSYHKGDSPFRVQDMAGNVWEWTSTPYCNSYAKTCTPDPSHRVVRGGSWNYFDPSWVRAAVRFWDLPSDRNGGLGFRCARTAGYLGQAGQVRRSP